MPDQFKPVIPKEILQAEERRAQPTPVERPGILGLPGLPEDLLLLAETYVPYLVLIMSVMAGFGAVGGFTALKSQDPAAITGHMVIGSFLSLVAAVGGLLAYVWLQGRRRIGWYTLVFVMIIQLLSQVLTSGVSSILFTGVEVIVTFYILYQLRDSYPD
jgi:hypothetical protein